jgi:hypothetical protein
MNHPPHASNPWTPRRSDLIACVAGVFLPLVMFFASSIVPIPFEVVLAWLVPGFMLGLSVVFGNAAGTAGPAIQDLGWVILTLAAVNGLLYALVWYFGRVGLKGSRVALAVVVIAVGIWTAWYARSMVINTGYTEAPPMPVNLDSPLAGRWEGVVHGTTRDVPYILIFHPRTDGRLDGLQYMNGLFMGELRGMYVRDSVYFSASGTVSRGRRTGDSLTLHTMHRYTQREDLRFVTADTTRLDLPPMVP